MNVTTACFPAEAQHPSAVAAEERCHDSRVLDGNQPVSRPAATQQHLACGAKPEWTTAYSCGTLVQLLGNCQSCHAGPSCTASQTFRWPFVYSITNVPRALLVQHHKRSAGGITSVCHIRRTIAKSSCFAAGEPRYASMGIPSQPGALLSCSTRRHVSSSSSVTSPSSSSAVTGAYAAPGLPRNSC